MNFFASMLQGIVGGGQESTGGTIPRICYCILVVDPAGKIYSCRQVLTGFDSAYASYVFGTPSISKIGTRVSNSAVET